jgi:hypothetical protein
VENGERKGIVPNSKWTKQAVFSALIGSLLIIFDPISKMVDIIPGLIYTFFRTPEYTAGNNGATSKKKG